MAIPLDQAQTEQNMEQAGDSSVPSKDVEIAFRMGVKLLKEGNGIQLIKDAIDKSQDPAMVIGQFLTQLIGSLAQSLSNEINLDPRVFLAKGGWLELILDYIEQELGYPEEFSDQIYGEVLETIKAAAQQPPAPNNVMSSGGTAPAGGGLGG